MDIQTPSANFKKKPKTKDVFKFARIILKSKMIPNRNGFDSFIRKEDVKEAIQTSHNLLEDYLQENQ